MPALPSASFSECRLRTHARSPQGLGTPFLGLTDAAKAAGALYACKVG